MKYITIKENVETQIVEKKSKFIANIISVENKEKAEKELQKIKKKYYDARHNCFAYRILDENQELERASDDGEPSGTAGAPILDILRGENLINVIVIVTRYFGGILLGTGGLVKAYSEATSKAIENTEKIELKKIFEIKITLEYQDLEKLKQYLIKNGGKIIQIEYCEQVKINLYIPYEQIDKFTKKYSNVPFNIIKYEILEEKFADISTN